MRLRFFVENRVFFVDGANPPPMMLVIIVKISEISMALHTCLFDHCSASDKLKIRYSTILMLILSFLCSEGRRAGHRPFQQIRAP